MKTLFVFLSIAGAACGACQKFDFVVYGGTAAGVTAAVAAARNGLQVALVAPERHLGGMVTGGLSATDFGNYRVIGGLSREVFQRIGKHYGKPVEWRFEPHVAEQVMNDMLREAKVTVFTSHRLKERGGVTAQGARLQQIITENGDRFCAVTFADTSYEGDLMGQANVKYTWGRESEQEYGESLAGVRGRQRKDHHFNVRVSPFDAKGALLPEVFAGPKGKPGEGDKKMQAYTYRMCLSDDPGNLVPFSKPAGYDVRRYELLARLIAALEADHGHAPGMKEFMLMLRLPSAKFDINSFGGYSTDHIGANWDYATASYKRRGEIWKDHRGYEAGFFYFLSHDERVPAPLRAAVGALGLAKDEFTDNGNWPYQLYIREARRMIGEYVMTQPDIQDRITKPDSIGLGSYQSDSHHVQRIATPDGAVENEGEMYVPTHPYQIPFRVMLPKRGQADNLLVPVCFSATHVTYSTIRMEPQYMILGQAAGTAAAIGKKSGRLARDVDTAELQRALRAEKAILDYSEIDNSTRD